MSKTRMGKRVASLLLSLVMMLSLLPTTVYATGGTGETNGAIVEANTSDDNTVGETTGNPELTGEDEGGGAANVSEGKTATVATIGSATYETLDEAIAAVADGETIVVNAGEYTLNGSLNYTGKAFTIAAAEGAKVSFDMSAAVALHGAKITFNNVTFDYKTNGNYIGLQHADTLVYNNCTINGMVFLYAVNETFNGCTFNQTSAGAYNVWTYGAQNAAFNGCTFNCVGKAVLVYNEGTDHKTDLTVTKTSFNASAPVTGKAAIEIDTSLMKNGGATITVDEQTKAEGFAAGSNSGNSLWNDKMQTADTNKNTTVTVGGVEVFVPKATASAVATTKDGREYATLTEALAAVTESNPLTSVTEEAWPAATPVYYNGSFYATIGELLYDAQQKTGAITPENAPDTAVIYCRPGTTIPTGKASHPSFVTSTTIYGNGATLSGVTEWDVENYYTLTKDITINLYSLNGGASVWGTRRSDYAVTVNMVDCKDAHEVLFNYGSGDGKVIVTVKDSTFLKSGGAAHGWPVSINCLGSLLVDGCTFDGVTTGVVVNVKQPSENGKMDVTVKNSTFNNVTGQDSNKGALRVTGQQACDIDLTIENVAFTGTHADPEDITIGNVKSEENLGKVSYNISGTEASMTTHKAGATEAAKATLVSGTTYTGTNAATAAGDGTEAKPYTLEQLGTMTRQAYIDAQDRLNGTMYVTVGDYTYGTNGVLGNGVRDDTTGQIPDHSKLNAYGENGYLGEKNDGANGKSVVFVGGSITSGVTGYTSIDKIGTSLLLALPAYTNVTFKGITFNNVMSFNYQLYTSPWSQLGELKFDGCTFNGIIVGAIAAQTLTFNGCVFENYTNTTDANSSNPTWIRPAYGNWTQGDNEGQGSDFRSLTTINFTGNTVTSTRPVKFEYISQWNITSTVTATGNSFDISKQAGDTAIKNVGLYLGAHTDANAFNLVAENNTKSENTAALYTIPEGKTSLPLGSTVKDTKGNEVELTDALKWKAENATADKIVLKTVEAVASVGSKQYGSLQAAIDAATAEQTVTLLTNLDLSATGLTIAANKDVTLDLNGKTLKVANTNSGNIKVVGKLTLQDSTDTAKNGTGTGKVWTETPYISGKQDKVLVAAIDGGTFIMESGLIDAASSIADNANNGQFAVSVQNENADATVIINGGCIKAGWYAIAGNGQDTTYNGNITVNGGILESTADYAIYHPHSGTTTINGGVVFGAAGGVSLNRGKLIVNDGIITSKGTGTTGDWGDGTGNQNAAAINVNAQYGLASVEIKGGKITAEKDAILLTNGKDGTISVSGGTFSSEVPAEYCAAGYTPVKNADGTYGVELGNYVVVGGIKGFENTKFASFADAYDAIKPVLETICEKDALGQGTPANAEAFDAVFTDVKDGRATLTYTITGNVTYDETGYANLLTMGRRSSHYLTNERHLINFKFVGAEAERGATLTVNSNITLPYEWWGEKITTAISFENLTITGSASNGLYTYQPYFEGIDFTVNNCTLKGIKIYNCANVGGSYTITNSTLDGTGAPAGAYAIHLQGNETAPLNITISGNQISGYDRGINIDQNTAEATISGNTIGINDVNRSCIQLTRLANTEVKDNTLNLNGGNAFTLHKNLAAGSKINIAGNTINNDGYLIYDNTKQNIALTYTNNTITGNVDTTKGVYDGKTHALTDGVDVVINGVKAAQIGDVKYETLAEAIAAAKDGETVTLLADATEDVTIDKNITLDLGGKTLTNTGAGKATVTIAKGATATVQNGSIIGGTSYYNIQNNGIATFTGVTATAGNTGSSMIDNWGTLTIESGTYEGGLNVVKSEEGSTLTINGGKFTGTYAPSSGYTAVILVYGNTTITGGEFIQSVTTTGSWAHPQVVMTGVVEGYEAFTTVTGGTFTNKKSGEGIFRGLGKATSDNFEVSGGTFNKSVPDSYFKDGYFAKKTADGYTADGPYAVRLGTTAGYATLEEAFAAAKSGDTITLLTDCESDRINLETKSITVDLNGKVLTSTAAYGVMFCAKNGHKITVKGDTRGSKLVGTLMVTAETDGRIVINGGTYENNQYCPIYINGAVSSESSTLTVKNATITALPGDSNQDNGVAVYLAGYSTSTFTRTTITAPVTGLEIRAGKLTLTNCTVTGGSGEVVTNANGNGTTVTNAAVAISQHTTKKDIDVTITGGTYTATAAVYQTNVQGTGSENVKVSIKSGTFKGAVSAETNNTVAVSGGTFSSAVKEEYCATGYIPKDNGDGTYGVKEGVYVAKVDNVKYETLQAAIDAAKGGSTVRLLANVTLTETAVFPAGKTVHLNLVGHNITATGTALRINGTTDIQSTGGVGTIESTGNVAVAVGNNASLTVYSGTLKGREGAVITGTSTGAKIEIKKNATLIATDNAVIAGNGSQRDGKPNTILVRGGTFIGGIVTDGYIACGIYAPWNDNVTVSGGTFNITNGAGIVARAGTVKVTGGTFNCTGTAEGYVGDSKNKVPCAALVFDKAAKYPALTESSQILVSGGSFSTDPAVNGATLADGYVATQTDGMYKVAKADPTAEINGVKYDTLQAAINAAQATKGGATITLLKNINTESYYMVNGDNPVTIDLAGYNITGSGISGLFYVTAKGDLTIKGKGTVTAVEDNGAAMAVWVRSPIAKVTLEGGTYTQQITNTADPHFDLIYVERGNVYVKGGTYKGATPDWTLNCYDEHYQSKEANIEVTGGTFVGFDPANNKAEGENTNFVPAGYVSTKGADGNFVVTEVKVAEVNGVAYATLSEAIAAAKDGDTVKLLRDINTPEISYMISKSLTIDLNGMTVTGSGYDAVFQIDNADAKVVIKNGKVVAVEQSGSAGKYTMAIWASKAGCEVTLEGLDVSQKITHTDDPQMDMIYASGGTITINSGNFVSGTPAWTLNCKDTSYKNGTANIIVKGGTFANFDPANNKAEGENTNFVAAGYVSRMDEDGSYTVVPANAKITVGKRLSIGNDLTITYLVNLTDCTNPWVKFQFYNDDIKGYTTVEVKNYGTATVEGPDGRPVEVFTFDFTGVNPQRMTDTLKATVYAEDASGNVVEYQVADYSVAQYCSNKLAKLGQDDSLRKLIGNLVAYGAAAQVYQNYRTDNLVSTVVSGAVSTDYTDRLSSVTQYTGKVTGAAGVTIKGKTLVLSNTFAVRVYFTVNEGVDIANVSFNVTANGKTDTVNSFEKDEKLGYYYFDYANLNATQLDSEVKFESFVNETGVGDMVTYSVNTYLAKKMPNYDKSSNAYKLMAELFNYGCACTEYASK